MSAEVRFLNIARAIETFHRKLRKERKSNKKIDDWIKETKKSVPTKYKEKINTSLGFIQTYSLGERVKALCKELEDTTINELNFQVNWETKFTKSRNYYTHFGGDISEGVLKGEDLVDLSNKVRKLLYVLVAKELGIKEKIIREKLYNLILL